MPFTPVQPTAKPTVPPIGPRNATIAIVGEAPGFHEERAGKPFVGAAGNILDQCLHSAGLIRAQIYITNVVKEKPKDNIIAPYWSQGKGFTELGRECVDKVTQELTNLPNLKVILTLGNVPTDAFTGYRAITKVRGYPFRSMDGLWIIPCIHPAAALRGKYLWRYYIMHDLMRAARYAKPGFELPKIDAITDLTFEETCEWLRGFRKQSLVSFDIEVQHYQVSCISFTSSKNFAISIPMVGVWNLEQETLIWRLIAELLEDPSVEKVGQNLPFDITFLALVNNIHTRGYIHDTMIEHSVMYPDFEKSLGFLGSIYTDVPYWKDLVSFKRIKKDD